MQLSSMGCLADNAKEQQKREGRDPLAERGRLVVSATRACDCEKAGTHWLNVGCVGTELFSLPSHHVRFQECSMNSLVMTHSARDDAKVFVSECFKRALVANKRKACAWWLWFSGIRRCRPEVGI